MPPPGMMGPQGQIAYPMQQQGQSPYGVPPPSMGGYQSPYGQSPYSDVVKNVSPPPNYYSQNPQPQPGYRGPQ